MRLSDQNFAVRTGISDEQIDKETIINEYFIASNRDCQNQYVCQTYIVNRRVLTLHQNKIECLLKWRTRVTSSSEPHAMSTYHTWTFVKFVEKK